jgi:hypothetical protein
LIHALTDVATKYRPFGPLIPRVFGADTPFLTVGLLPRAPNSEAW